VSKWFEYVYCCFLSRVHHKYDDLERDIQLRQDSSLPLGNNDVHTRSAGPTVKSDLSRTYINILKILDVISISAFGISNTAFLREQFLTYCERIGLYFHIGERNLQED
jgi:hypothetical protein